MGTSMALVALLAACSGGGSGGGVSPTSTDFTALTGVIAVGPPLLTNTRRGLVTDGNVGTAAFVMGVDTNVGQIVAQSAYRADNIGAPRSSGTGRYSTNYRFGIVDQIVRTDTRIGGRSGIRSGTVEVSADFDAGRVQAVDQQLNLDVRISGDALSGTVDVAFVPASGGTATETLETQLEGRIGSNGLVGAFHGRDGNTTIAGGFVGTAIP